MPHALFARLPGRAPLVALALLLSACTRGGPAANLPGALDRPIDRYSPDEFLAFARTLRFGGGAERPRKCKQDPGCEGTGGKLTAARVDAVVGQDSLDLGAVPVNGVVAVRARNTGAYVERRYGMLPGPFEYYLVIYPAAGDSAAWRMQQVDTTSGARTMTQVASGTFRACTHRFAKLKYHANFYSCANSHQAGDTVLKMGLQASGADEITADPIWMSCAHGCCVAM